MDSQVKTTRTGRVVYERKKHRWRIKDCIRILIKIGNEYDHMELSKQAIGINTLKTIVDTSLYPFYLYAISESVRVGDLLGEDLRGYLKEKTQDFARELSNTIGEEVGIPLRVREFVLEVLFDPIYEAIDRIITAITGKEY